MGVPAVQPGQVMWPPGSAPPVPGSERRFQVTVSSDKHLFLDDNPATANVNDHDENREKNPKAIQKWSEII